MAAKLPRASELQEKRNLLRVIVQIGDRKFDEDLAEQAAIAPNVEALNEALASNPGLFAQWAMLEAEARKEHDAIRGQLAVLEADIKDAEARIYLEILADPQSIAAKPTVDAVKARVQVDPRRLKLVEERQAMERAALEAKGALDVLGVGRKTIEEKKDSLLELARNWRAEMQGKLTVGAESFRPGGR